MSGIAEVMHNLGYRVQGSDISESPNVRRLRDKGIEISIGHSASNVHGVDAVVISTAIGNDNPEVAVARAKHIPVVRRADMLAELMRLKWNVCIAGTHGKTTTTSLLAALMDAAGLDPTVINGGVINAWDTNARVGEGDWMVVEADESDGTFIRLPITIGVITNIDPEHLDHYGEFSTLRHAFDEFIENTPFYGFGVVCLDHPEVQALIGRVTDRRLITYGINPQADVRATDIGFVEGHSQFTILFRHRGKEEARIENVRLPMPGRHNIQNALAAAIVARELGATPDQIKQGFAKFAGVKRRFSRVGSHEGVTIIDDYGHHPVEIAAVLQAARSVCDGRIIAVVQPHRFTRLRDLFDDFCTCFNEADSVLVSEVYAAGESPIDGYDQHTLVSGITDHGHRDVAALEGWERLPAVIREKAQSGDYVVCLGAGDVTRHAADLADRLAKLDPDAS